MTRRSTILSIGSSATCLVALTRTAVGICPDENTCRASAMAATRTHLILRPVLSRLQLQSLNQGIVMVAVHASGLRVLRRGASSYHPADR